MNVKLKLLMWKYKKNIVVAQNSLLEYLLLGIHIPPPKKIVLCGIY
jgi:hypothetical protein